jgi:hypothetical protein
MKNLIPWVNVALIDRDSNRGVSIRISISMKSFYIENNFMANLDA